MSIQALHLNFFHLKQMTKSVFTISFSVLFAIVSNPAKITPFLKVDLCTLYFLSDQVNKMPVCPADPSEVSARQEEWLDFTLYLES